MYTTWNLTYLCKEIKPVHPKGNQSWIFIGRTDAEAPILWPLDMKSSLEKILMLGKTEGRRRRGWQRMRWLGGISDSMDVSLSKLQEMLIDRETWHAAVHGITKSQTWHCKKTTTMHFFIQPSATLWDKYSYPLIGTKLRNITNEAFWITSLVEIVVSLTDLLLE